MSRIFLSMCDVKIFLTFTLPNKGNNKITELRAILQRESQIREITKLPNSEQSYKGKVKTHKYANRQNQSTTEKLRKP
jgi:hypothetical protein